MENPKGKTVLNVKLVFFLNFPLFAYQNITKINFKIELVFPISPFFPT